MGPDDGCVRRVASRGLHLFHETGRLAAQRVSSFSRGEVTLRFGTCLGRKRGGGVPSGDLGRRL